VFIPENKTKTVSAAFTDKQKSAENREETSEKRILNLAA